MCHTKCFVFSLNHYCNIVTSYYLGLLARMLYPGYTVRVIGVPCSKAGQCVSIAVYGALFIMQQYYCCPLPGQYHDLSNFAIKVFFNAPEIQKIRLKQNCPGLQHLLKPGH